MVRLFEGKNILVARASDQAGELSMLIKDYGGNPIEIPVIKISPVTNFDELDNGIKSLRSYDWIIFSSVNGVNRVFERIFDLGLDYKIFQGSKIGAIGPATSKALIDYGVNIDLKPQEYVSESMLTEFTKIGINGKLILLFSAVRTSNILHDGLIEAGALIKRISVYSTATRRESGPILNDVMSKNQIDIVTFTSSSTVKGFLDLLNGRDELINVIIACIGPVTANTARDNGLDVHIVAKVSTISSLVSGMIDYFRE